MSHDAGGVRIEAPRAGAFVAVVGPSGAGKDTLIARAKIGLAGSERLVFAQRTVTRTANRAAEDHRTLDEGAFDAAKAAGAFCLTWQAHGLQYGLPARLRTHCSQGSIVVANLSRRVLPDAARLFPVLFVMEVTARPELLIARILARGRETSDEGAARLARRAQLEPPPSVAGHYVIDNSGDLDVAAHEFATRLGWIAGHVG